ncbi:MAG: response regulator [Bryobacterales bacterium]|nr:response regulator [Bryobacterales bacterium]
MPAVKEGAEARSLELARVLLVDDDVTSRLTLQTVLEAGGYCVDVAASAAEAVGKLDEQEYELVLSDLGMESPRAGLRVLAHARLKDYQPATALVTAYHGSKPRQESRRAATSLFVETEDLAGLLGHVAELIGLRASRRLARSMRQPSVTTS